MNMSLSVSSIVVHLSNSFVQDGLLSLAVEMNAWESNERDTEYKIDAACFTLKYCQRYFLEKVSTSTKKKSTGTPKPIFKEKIGSIFRCTFS